jgi:type VI secretion system protein VasI
MKEEIVRNLGFLLLLLFSCFAFADEKTEIAKCAANKSDAERLICFDALAKTLGVDQPKTKVTTGIGKWNLQEDKSPIDDTVNVYLSIISNEPVSSGYNTVKPSLFIRCSEGKTNVFLNWGLYLGLDETKMLTRFDKEKAETSSWSISTDNKAIFFQGKDIEFAKKLMQHETLLTQITPYGQSPVMATFEISGLKEAIIPLREACKW